MASIQDYIYFKLSATSSITDLVSNRTYPQVIPQTEVRPSIVYSVISNVPTNTKSGGSSLDAIRVQFVIMADNVDEYSGQDKVNAIGEAVRNLFEFIQNDTQEGVTIQQSYFMSEVDSFDTTGGQDGTYMKFQDYIFWKTR
jgi:hypothetical protein